MLSIEGRHAEAIKTAAEAVEIFPGCGDHWRALGLAQFRARRFADAARSWRRWAELHAAQPEPLYRLFLLYDLNGEAEPAAGELPPLLELYGLPATVVDFYRGRESKEAVRTYLAKRLEFLDAADEERTLVDRATLAAHLGDDDRALADLERAERLGDAGLLPALADPDFDRLRSHPRFAALATRLLTPRRPGAQRTATPTPEILLAGNPPRPGRV